MGHGPSLAGRAVIAVLLTVGFYVLALGIAGALGLVVYEGFADGRHLNGRVLLFAVATIGIILWSVAPRWDRFPDPGVLLRPEEQPELHRLVGEVAAATQQAPPAEVFLLGDVNAFVAQRGGIVGIGSRRVMGIGLPLLQVLNVSELRGVLAHEFGHFHGGDTRLGPWIYKTRAAIGRVVANFARAGSLLRLPFQWYGLLFLRITHAISRRQELAADALSVCTVGVEPVRQALVKVAATAPLFHSYLQGEFLPALQSELRPPLAAGFAAFLASAAGQQAIAASAERPQRSDPFDTHPPLAERLAAAGQVASRVQPAVDDRGAIDLLRQLPQLEVELLALQTGRPEVRRFPQVRWEDCAERMLPPHWREVMRQHGAIVPRVTLGELHAQYADAGALARRMDPQMPPERHAAAASWLLGCAAADALVRAGFSVQSMPGEPIRLCRGAHVLEPFGLMQRLQGDAAAAAQWRQQCEAAGIAGLPLAGDAAPPQTAGA